MKEKRLFKSIILITKILLTIVMILICPCIALLLLLFLLMGVLPINASSYVLLVACSLFLPSLIPFLWSKKKKKYLVDWGCGLLAFVIAFTIPFSIEKYNESITIDVAPYIYTSEYLPFVEDSKIVKMKSKTLRLEHDLPIIDGATAAFPVYSAFVNAVYPETTELYDGVFEYNNTVGGYIKLAEKKTDIFIGAYPSAEQIRYAQGKGTTFEYTQIGSEAFVFFVHKDNPIDSLTVEQIKGIYSGEITNWSEVGGKRQKIDAFQRNEGSGSQTMMQSFMGDTPLMEPDTTKVPGDMGGIIDRVADYQSKSSAIGFSFRYYIEGIVKHPDIKMIAVEGVAPNVENIKNNTYPITAPVYAVTYKDNPNKNVALLIDWILSDEGQYIIEESGYVGIKK